MSLDILVHKIFDLSTGYIQAKALNDHMAMNYLRYEVRKAREALVVKVSLAEDKDPYNTERPKTTELRHSLITADTAIRSAGLSVVLDDDAGNQDNFIPDPSIFDDAE